MLFNPSQFLFDLGSRRLDATSLNVAHIVGKGGV